MINSRLKRIFDFSFSLIALILLSPLFLLLAILIKLNDKGPVLFCHKRVGREGVPFRMYKFRTMKVLKSAEDGMFQPGNRLRVTTIGKFMRRTKLDELPQLLNVLKGDMSLVGPRPEVELWVTIYPEKWVKILSVRPGMTDNASIVFHDEEDILSKSRDPEETYRTIILPRKLDLYIDYLNNYSFIRDISIILRTMKTIIFR
jgi:lipopolysaccharide/colanic/teichoic acid biosynthesis glycosyltransferase